MPEYAGISISLQSQYDAATIKKSCTRLVTTPTPMLDLDRVSTPGLAQHPDKTFADLHEDKKAASTPVIVETVIPTFPSAQFWVCYSCPDPTSTNHSWSVSDHAGEEEVKFYFFRLLLTDKSDKPGTCITSWGVGARDDWQGKMMFGLFDGGRDFEGKRVVEKRGLFFPGLGAGDGPGGPSGGFEIQVFRAKGRKRREVVRRTLGEVLGGRKAEGGGVELTCVGKVQRGERQRFYSYALLDAKDEPWMRFRYKFQSADATTALESTLLSMDLQDTTTTCATEMPDEMEDSTVDEVTESSLWTGLEQNTPPPSQQPSFADNDTTYATSTRRLSFPPRNLLYPSTSRAEPSSPVKQQASASDDDLTRPRARNVEYSSIAMAESPNARRTTEFRKAEWTVGASSLGSASPGSDRDGPGGRRVHKKTSSGSGGLLKSVVSGALRRRAG